MKKEVIISIKGKQRVDGEDDIVELTTMGNYYIRDGIQYIRYDESGATGYDGCKTTLKVKGNDMVTMIRSGPCCSQLIVEKGRRHQCHYATETVWTATAVISIFSILWMSMPALPVKMKCRLTSRSATDRWQIWLKKRMNSSKK